jgi:hypothetical protein
VQPIDADDGHVGGNELLDLLHLLLGVELRGAGDGDGGVGDVGALLAAVILDQLAERRDSGAELRLGADKEHTHAIELLTDRHRILGQLEHL